MALCSSQCKSRPIMSSKYYETEDSVTGSVGCSWDLRANTEVHHAAACWSL